MRISGLLFAVLLSASLLSACGGGDSSSDDKADGGSGDKGGELSSADAAGKLDLSCTFTPNQNPGVIGLGDVSITGSNTTDTRIDAAMVEFSVTGSSGTAKSSASVPYFMPGEQLQQWAPVLSETKVGDDATCKVTKVTGGDYAGKPQLDPEGASCKVTGEARNWVLTADLSGVEGLPAQTKKFVGVVAQLDGKRYQIAEQELATGKTTLVAQSSSEAQPTCAVRYVRDV